MFGSSQQLVRGDGEIAHSFSRGVEKCLCDSGARSRNPNFADASDAERIQLRVGDIDGRDLGSPRYQRSPEGVVRKIGVHDPAIFRVDLCVFEECPTNPPDDSADELAPCELLVDDIAGILDGYDAPCAHDAQVRIGCDLREHSAKRMA